MGLFYCIHNSVMTVHLSCKIQVYCIIHVYIYIFSCICLLLAGCPYVPLFRLLWAVLIQGWCVGLSKIYFTKFRKINAQKGHLCLHDYEIFRVCGPLHVGITYIWWICYICISETRFKGLICYPWTV